MGNIRLGNNLISNVKLGNAQVNNIYLGTNLIWSLSSYSTELQAIINRANLEGFAIPAASQLLSVDNLITAYKASGVWNKMDRIYNFAYNNAPNLIRYSQELDNAAWSKSNSNVTANAITAPDATMTADKIFENTATNSHLVFQTLPSYSLTQYSMSFYLKAAEKTVGVVNFSDNVTSFIRSFTLTGSGSVDNPAGTTITSVGDGWYYCTMSRTTNASSTSLTLQFYTATGSYLGDGVSGYYVWGVQVEKSATATAYYKTPNPYLINFARIDWKNPSTSPLLTLNGGLAFEEQGYRGNGLDAYINTGFIPSTHGSNYTLNNASRVIMVYTALGNVLDGNTVTSNNGIFATSTALHRINTTNTLVGGNVNLGGNGLKSINRDDSTNLRLYNRTVESARTATSTALSTNPQTVLRDVSTYGSSTISNYMLGASITSAENLAIRNDFNAYLIDIGLTPNTTV